MAERCRSLEVDPDDEQSSGVPSDDDEAVSSNGSGSEYLIYSESDDNEPGSDVEPEDDEVENSSEDEDDNEAEEVNEPEGVNELEGGNEAEAERADENNEVVHADEPANAPAAEAENDPYFIRAERDGLDEPEGAKGFLIHDRFNEAVLYDLDGILPPILNPPDPPREPSHPILVERGKQILEQVNTTFIIKQLQVMREAIGVCPLLEDEELDMAALPPVFREMMCEVEQGLPFPWKTKNLGIVNLELKKVPSRLFNPNKLWGSEEECNLAAERRERMRHFREGEKRMKKYIRLLCNISDAYEEALHNPEHKRVEQKNFAEGIYSMLTELKHLRLQRDRRELESDLGFEDTTEPLQVSSGRLAEEELIEALSEGLDEHLKRYLLYDRRF